MSHSHLNNDLNSIMTNNKNRTSEEVSVSEKVSVLNDQILHKELIRIDAALDDKVDKIEGKGLSSNDFTDSYKNAVDTNSAKVSNVQADWDAESGDAQILNKPTIPAAPIQSDYTQSDVTKLDYIKNKPNLATVATSGSYNDLSDQIEFNSTYNATSNKAATMTDVTNAVTGVYLIMGNASVSDLNNATKTASMNGHVYNIMGTSGNLNNSDNSTESATEGDNVVLIWNGGNWYWDKLAATINLSNYQTVIGSSNKISADYISDGSTNKVYTGTEQTKLSGIASGAQVNVLESISINGTAQSISSKNVNLPAYPTKSSLGLSNVDNTSDSTKKTNFTGSIASGNTGFATGGDVYSALSNKQNTLTFDSSPTASSNNPVKSGGVYTALEGKQDTIDSSHKLSSDLVDDTNKTHLFVSSSEKSTWSGKQDALVFNTTYNASSNKVATMTDINNAVSNIYKLQGNASTVDLMNATKSASLHGCVYNISSISTYDYVENSDSTREYVAVGDNVVFVWDGTNTWHWDKLAATVNLSGYQTLISSTNKVSAANISGLANVATSGSYADLSNKPSIPDAVSGTNDGTNWTSITIGSTTKAIPAGGGGTPDSISAATINALFGYAITTTVTNGTASGASFIYTGETATITITPATGYVAPSSVTITNATQVSYDSSTGVLVIGSAIGAVSISVVCDVAPSGYTLSVSSINQSPWGDAHAYYSLDNGSTWIEITSSGVLTTSATQVKFKAMTNNSAMEGVDISSTTLGLDISEDYGETISQNYTLSGDVTDITVEYKDYD